MDDLIKRQDAIGKIKDWMKFIGYSHSERNVMECTIQMLEELPSAGPKFVEVTIDTDGDLLARKIASYKEAIYVNRQTMIVYVPLFSVALVTELGGTIKRKGERDG